MKYIIANKSIHTKTNAVSYYAEEPKNDSQITINLSKKVLCYLSCLVYIDSIICKPSVADYEIKGD